MIDSLQVGREPLCNMADLEEHKTLSQNLGSRLSLSSPEIRAFKHFHVPFAGGTPTSFEPRKCADPQLFFVVVADSKARRTSP